MIEPLRVALLRDAVADEGEARCAEGDEFIRIDGDVAGSLAAEGCVGGSVLDEVAGHPVILASGEALNGFAEVTSQQRGSAFARRADEDHGETLIEGHGD